MRKAARAAVRIDGPLQVQPGNVYCVVYSDRANYATNPASLNVCLSIAEQYNRKARRDFAYVKYLEPSKKEDTNNG